MSDTNEVLNQEESAVETAPALTNAEIVAEATNAPALSKDQFVLGERTFTVVSLGYRQYLQFVSKLEPILKSVASKVKDSVLPERGNAVHVPGLILTGMSSIDASALLSFCSEDLPAMVQIVCNMEKLAADKNAKDLVTVDWIEDVAEDPFVLIDIVLRQINKNQMISKFASFFAQLLPMFLGMKTPAPAK